MFPDPGAHGIFTSSPRSLRLPWTWYALIQTFFPRTLCSLAISGNLRDQGSLFVEYISWFLWRPLFSCYKLPVTLPCLVLLYYFLPRSALFQVPYLPYSTFVIVTARTWSLLSCSPSHSPNGARFGLISRGGSARGPLTQDMGYCALVAKIFLTAAHERGRLTLNCGRARGRDDSGSPR